MASRRPRVTLKCPADRYAGAGERIVEFFDDGTGKGGLISIRADAHGRLIVDVYRCDDGVTVRGPHVNDGINATHHTRALARR